MTPLEFYHKKLASGEVLPDPQQEYIMQMFDVIHQKLIATHGKTNSFLNKLFKHSPVKGLYLWGSVGAGKTFLVDTFYHCLPFEEKLRIHFHKFMELVHERLGVLQGEKNPLTLLAKEFAAEYRVICFDELLVNDIADAMLLGGLFQALFAQGVCLFFTSNTAPDELYKNGLQRERFLPAIELIIKNTDIFNLKLAADYRLNYVKHAKFYWYPLTLEARNQLDRYFSEFSGQAAIDFAPIEIYGRMVPVKKKTTSVIWFDFMDLCNIPRSQRDYLFLAEKYPTILISNLTAIRQDQSDVARLFIELIDVLYDDHTRLIISASHPIEQLYTQGRMLNEFARTRSRLLQMQSSDWANASRK